MPKALLLVCTCFLILTACGSGEPGIQPTGEIQDWSSQPTLDWQEIPGKLPQSMKGYELYSWQAGKIRVYTLITGTNRSKSFEEITALENTIDGNIIKISVTSLTDLKTLLSRLPAAEEVFWGGINLEGQVSDETLYFSYPAEEDMAGILHFSQEIGIKLHTIQDEQKGE